MQTKVEICGVNTSGLPVLSAKKTDELLKKSAAGDKQARDELIRGNLRLVLSVVQRFQGRGESPDDLFQVGCIGLMKAIDNFNTELGVRFSPYAVPMIIGGVITGSIMITSARQQCHASLAQPARHGVPRSAGQGGVHPRAPA